MHDAIGRRDVVTGIGAIAAGVVLSGTAGAEAGIASRRPPLADRRFTSPAVEAEIARVSARIADPEIAWLFGNCYPNTLDTTVEPGTVDGKPDTFVITGDIDAMWLRDSSAQLQAYVRLAAHDPALRRLIQGALQRQARCILIDPYANAFMKDPTAPSSLGARTDLTEMRPGVAERKWEIDSLCYPMRLAHRYWTATHDAAPFDATWCRAMAVAVATLAEQRRLDGPGPYHFQRRDVSPIETLMFGGYGAPTRKVGLIHSGFRPSDDACTYPFLIPSNLFAVAALGMLATVLREACGDAAAAREATALAASVRRALDAHGTMPDGRGGTVWAYEVDGFGNAIFIDDANVPNLSGLPLIDAADRRDPLWRRTAALAWSDRNPYFFRGAAAEGIGGPHVGMDMIWPMSIITRALTSDGDATIRRCLRLLKTTHAGTGFMHESFDKDRPQKFSRRWFAWANGLFGELILDLARRRPALLAERF